MKLSHLVFAVSAVAAGATGYAQQAPKAEDQIRYRQSIMNVMGRQFGIEAVLHGGARIGRGGGGRAAGRRLVLFAAALAARAHARQMNPAGR